MRKLLLNIALISYDEVVEIFHDKGILLFILFVPLFYPLLYSYVYTNEVVREVPAAVVDDNHSALSRELIRKIDASPDVLVQARCDNMEDAKDLLKKKKIYGIIHIPASFTDDIYNGDQTYIGLYCDMCSMLYYKALLVTATNVSLEMNKDIKIEKYIPGTTSRQDEVNKMPIEYNYIALYNPQSGFAAFLIPPVLMLIIQQTLLLSIGMSMGRSREKNGGYVIPVNERIRSNPFHIVMGKSIPYFFIYILMAYYMYAPVTKWFALPHYGDIVTFSTFIIPYLLACIFMAIVLSAFIYRREDCIMLFVFISVPMLFLSGVSWPAPSMPRFWRYFSYLFPSTFGMNAYVRIHGMGASVTDIAFELKGLWIQTLVYFGLACLMYRSYWKRIPTPYKAIH